MRGLTAVIMAAVTSAALAGCADNGRVVSAEDPPFRLTYNLSGHEGKVTPLRTWSYDGSPELAVLGPALERTMAIHVETWDHFPVEKAGMTKGPTILVDAASGNDIAVILGPPSTAQVHIDYARPGTHTAFAGALALGDVMTVDERTLVLEEPGFLREFEKEEAGHRTWIRPVYEGSAARTADSCNLIDDDVLIDRRLGIVIECRPRADEILGYGLYSEPRAVLAAWRGFDPPEPAPIASGSTAWTSVLPPGADVRLAHGGMAPAEAHREARSASAPLRAFLEGRPDARLVEARTEFNGLEHDLAGSSTRMIVMDVRYAATHGFGYHVEVVKRFAVVDGAITGVRYEVAGEGVVEGGQLGRIDPVRTTSSLDQLAGSLSSRLRGLPSEVSYRPDGRGGIEVDFSFHAEGCGPGICEPFAALGVDAGTALLTHLEMDQAVFDRLSGK